MKENTCCFTGHRFIAARDVDPLRELLKKEIAHQAENGRTVFCAGGAMGFDTVAAECVLEAKKELSAKRTKFIETLDQIDEAERVLTEDDTFEVSSYRLIFALGASNYNSNDIFKISNRELLLHFVEFIRDKINKKIAEIEAELVK